MRTKTKKDISWGWVTFWCILFFPLGIWFLCMRLAADADNGNIKTNAPLYIIAYTMIVFGILFIIPWGIIGFLITMAIFAIPGIWLLSEARKVDKAKKRHHRYMELLRGRYECSIRLLASATRVTHDVALNDLLKMKNLGYFPQATILKDEIILVERPAPQAGVTAWQQAPQAGVTAWQQTPQANAAASVQEKVVVCKNCGANNKVSIKSGVECEYCGSPLG